MSESKPHPAIPAESELAWRADCLHWRGRVLVGEKAHWCFDWDELPVDETTPEIECCHCREVPK